MSAFQCSNKHINVLVNVATQRDFHCWWEAGGEQIQLEAQAMGELLANANALSVQTRYRNSSATETVEMAKLQRWGGETYVAVQP